MQIDAFDARITVRGRFDDDEQRIIVLLDGRSFLAVDFELEFLTNRYGWQAHSVVVSGWVLKKDGAPGRARAKARFRFDEESTPQWVYSIVQHCDPDSRAPRPRSENRHRTGR
ncbi:hypothetical protein QR97_01970 [Streptomyces sp. PBH53]|uniref:hypothetical protein n=1 Tax=Streptomyces sp. PBH53 TaxID=1577075 RepID=UPI000654D8FC|nr:hypothetical protein [Streptomyces sp. PBH53]AKN68733.1 hypothetical protein QR97_01970 [Streptomyces sp. PBH53]